MTMATAIKILQSHGFQITNITTMGYTIEEQIKEAERELAMRRNFYAKQVKAGKMTKETARKHYDLQQAIVTTLKNLKND